MMIIYVANYTLSRVMSIFLAMKLSSLQILALNGGSLVIGSILLLVANDSNLLFTKLGFVLSGFGMGSTFANMTVWVETYMQVTSKVAMIMVVGTSIGVNIPPLVVGQLIKQDAMVLIYLQAVS